MASRKRGKTTDSFFVDLPGLWQLHPLRRTSFGKEPGHMEWRSRSDQNGIVTGPLGPAAPPLADDAHKPTVSPP